VVLTLIGAWLVLGALATVVCTLVARGGLREDRLRGFLVDRPVRPDGTPALAVQGGP
jgi:hypothetical protein